MATKLFNSIIVGPIHSRRLGNSLGINLLPQYGKLCSFDCVYCECGWNKDNAKDKKIATAEEVREGLTARLNELSQQGVQVDSITFSGNGEPTLNPQFAEIVDITIELRNKLYPKAKISVLSNSTMLFKREVREALMKIDNPILKIDSAIESYVSYMNRPANGYSLQKTIEELKKFNGNFILQTMFLRGDVDCTNKEHCAKWVDLVRVIKPRQIMMYSLDRDTPAQNLTKVTPEEMRQIAQPLINEGFDVLIV